MVQVTSETKATAVRSPDVEFEEKAREIWDKVCWSDVKGAYALPIIADALSEAVAAERETCAKTAEWSASYFESQKMPSAACACRDVAFGIRRRHLHHGIWTQPKQGDRTAPERNDEVT